MGLNVPAGTSDGSKHHLLGGLAFFCEDLTVLCEHKGNTLDQTHSIHHRKTPDRL
jgi:hypothetical protein